MKKEYYRVVAVFDGVKKEDVPVQRDGEGRRIVSMDHKGRAFVACNIGADGYAEPAITLSRKPKYYQIALSLKERDNVVTLVVNKATGDILKPFYVTKEGVEKYAFGQTYLRGPARENWVISVWGDGRVIIDDVSLPIRGGKSYLDVVSGVINETFHTYLGSEFLERELQKFPDYMVQVIGPILSAHEELEKRNQIGGKTAMTAAFKQAFEEEIGKVLGAGNAASAKKN